MPVITISRQHGTRASVVVSKLAEKTGLKVAYRRDVEERLRGIVGTFLARKFTTEAEPSFFDTIFYNMPLWRGLLCESVTSIAREGNVIIYGRGASVILRDVPGVIHVLIVGDREKRIRWISEKHGISHVEAEEVIDSIERKREGFYSHHFGERWPDPGKYDITLNPHNLGIERCADILVSLSKIESISDDFKRKGKREIERRFIRVSSENRIVLATGLDHNLFDVEVEDEGTVDITFYDVPADVREKAVEAVRAFHKNLKVLQTTAPLSKAKKEMMT